jgi:MOSC domain-containing protein
VPGSGSVCGHPCRDGYFGCVASVSALTCYLVKGCAGVELDHAEVGMTGLPGDRLFAIVGADRAVVWQGAVPRMATIRASFAGSTLVLSAPGTDEVAVEVVTDAARSVEVDVEKWPGSGIDQGDDVAAWLSDFLGRLARLVREPARTARARRTNGTALLITSESSLDSLNDRILRRGATAVPMSRFRPNIVVTGWPDPHTEDRVHRMTIGTTGIGFGELAIRCAMTMTDQTTGHRHGPEPLRTLADYRREPDGVSFGLKATVLTPGHITIGDPVTITASNVSNPVR